MLDFPGLLKEFRFELLARLSRACLVLPHSSADVERVFSEMGNIKTKNRSRLEHDSLRSLTIVHNNKRSRVIENLDVQSAAKRYKLTPKPRTLPKT